MALPALLFRSTLGLDLAALDGPFLAAMLAAKWAVALGGALLSPALLADARPASAGGAGGASAPPPGESASPAPGRLTSAGLAALLVSCSNDLALGYPLALALAPAQASQLVLLSALQNLAVNPLLFLIIDAGNLRAARRVARVDAAAAREEASGEADDSERGRLLGRAATSARHARVRRCGRSGRLGGACCGALWRVLGNAAIVAVLCGVVGNLLVRLARGAGSGGGSGWEGEAAGAQGAVDAAGGGALAEAAALGGAPTADASAAGEGGSGGLRHGGGAYVGAALPEPLGALCSLLGALFPAAANFHLGLCLCARPPDGAHRVGRASAEGAALAAEPADDAQGKARGKAGGRHGWRAPLCLSLLKLGGMPPLARLLVGVALSGRLRPPAAASAGPEAAAALLLEREAALLLKLAWLYGALPTAPWLAAFACTHAASPLVASRTVGVSSLCALPLLALSVAFLFGQEGGAEPSDELGVIGGGAGADR